jgi:hypothetical protein
VVLHHEFAIVRRQVQRPAIHPSDRASWPQRARCTTMPLQSKAMSSANLRTPQAP